MNLQKIKRVSTGGFVKADVTGMDDWIVGRIWKFDDKYVYFNAADDSGDVKIIRQEAYKATKAEFDAEALKKMVPASFKGVEFKLEDGPSDLSIDDLGVPPVINVDKAAGKVDIQMTVPIVIQIRDEDEETTPVDAVRLNPNWDKYVTGGEDSRTVTISGRKTVDINDLVAQDLRANTIDEVYVKVAFYLATFDIHEIGKKNARFPTTVEGLISKYEHLNIGMQRMNLGNLVRNAMDRLGLTQIPTVGTGAES